MLRFRSVFFVFLLWRTALFLPLIISNLVLSYRTNQEFTNILSKLPIGSIVHSLFLFPWANFDGVHYLAIVQYGYTTEAGFFPLYPLIIKIFSLITGNSTIESYFFFGIFISSLVFAIGLMFLYKLIKFDFPEKIAKQSIIFLLIFPTSFFFACIYSESLFFLLLIMSFYFARKKMWFFAAITAMFLSATRIVGVLVLPALLWEFYILEKNNLRSNIKKAVPFILAPVGLFLYMLFNFLNWGNFLYFAQAQGMLSNNRSVDQIILIPQTLFRYFKIITTVPYQQFEWWIAILEVGVTLFMVVFLYVAYKLKVRTSYIIFSVFAFLLPVLTGTLSGMPRYVLVAFPVLIALGLIKNQWIKIIYSIVCVILLIILWTLFSKGYYVA